MQIRYLEADLFSTDIKHIVHGCNARGGFGSGVAGQIRKKYPEVREAYLRRYADQGNRLELGDIVWARTTDEDYWFGNMITQDNYGGAKTAVHADPTAIETAVIRLDSYMEGRRDCCIDKLGEATTMESVAMPAIGAGLANGDWQAIAPIIERRAIHFQPVVYFRKEDGHPMLQAEAKFGTGPTTQPAGSDL